MSEVAHSSRRVGAGRPLLGRPYPLSRTRTCTFQRIRLSPSPGYSGTQVSGQHQHTPLFLPFFSQVPLACFLPDRAGFASVTWVYPSAGTAYAACTSHYSRTLSNTMPPSPCRNRSLFR
jgi:hypothetical protein